MGSTMFEERRWRSWNPSSSLIITAVALPSLPLRDKCPLQSTQHLVYHPDPAELDPSFSPPSVLTHKKNLNSSRRTRSLLFLTIDFKYFSYFLEYVEPFFMLAHQSLSKFSINFLQMSSSEWMDSICKIFKKVFHHCFNIDRVTLFRIF